MLAFLLSEVAFFSTLITTYVVFLQQTKASNPSPAEVFHLPLVLIATACLLSSSVTIHLAEGAMRRGSRASFPRPLGADDTPRHHLFGLHRQRMARTDLHRRTHHQPQFIWQHLFHAGRLPRPARHHRFNLALDDFCPRLAAQALRTQPHRSRSHFLVLAFCRRRLDRRIFVGLFNRAIKSAVRISM